MCFRLWGSTFIYSQENLPLSAPSTVFPMEAPYRYHFQYFRQVIKLSPPPPSWPSCWLPLVHHGCPWSSRDRECKGSACWDVYVPAQGCIQSYTELFDSLQHRLASVYLSQFPTGFVCTIRAAQRGSKRAIPPFSNQQQDGEVDQRHHNVNTEHNTENAFVWLT